MLNSNAVPYPFTSIFSVVPRSRIKYAGKIFGPFILKKVAQEKVKANFVL